VGSSEALASEGLRRRVMSSVRRSVEPSRPWAARRWIATVGAIAALAALAIALLSSGGVPPDSAHIIAGLSGARASLRRVGSHAELVVSGMSAPPIGEIYEVWIDRPGQPPQATDTLFTVTREGRATVEVPGRLRGVREVMVTAEPLGGSSEPTSTPVLRALLAHNR